MTPRANRADSPTGRKVKTLAVCALAALASLTATVPAFAMPVGDGVRAGKNVSVFGNLDFVAAFGHPVGQRLTIDVYRGDTRIATAFGPAVNTPEGGGLEVNHGVEGNTVQGDCWENFTPDVRPGDRIVVTDAAGGTDQVLVDDIAISGPPEEDLTTADTTDIVVRGTASYADGTPIPEGALNSGELRLGSTFRANPNSVVRTPGTENGWTATYKAPYLAFKGQDLSPDQQKQAILDGDHAMGYGHIEPLPAETQLVEGLGAGGPAPGCEAVAPDAPASTMGVVSPELITRANANGTVEAGGVIQDGVDVSLRLNGEPGPAAEVDRTNGTWSARIPAADFRENDNEVEATFTGPGAPEQPQTASVQKDTTSPPAATADPAPGLYNADKLIELRTTEARTRIYYTTGEGDPDRLYAGERIPVTSTTTIKTRTVDAAGNAGEVEPLVYEIDKELPAAPTSNLDTTSYDAAQTLRLSSDAPDLKEIRYTLGDGTQTAPTARSGEVFPAGGSLNVPKTTTLKAVAVDRAGNASQVLEQKITIRTATRTTLGVAAANLKLGKARRISGSVLPNQYEGSVVLTIDRPGALPNATRRLPLDVFSRYAFTYKPPAVGTYRISVSFAKDADSLGSKSVTRSFKVVR